MNKALHSTAIMTCQTILMVAVLCFICFTHPHTASAQDSDIIIDGYELPDMFDDDASAPIQNHSSGVPEEKIITPHKTKIHKETQLPAPADNYESAFKPLQTVTSTKQETVSIPYPQPRPAQLAVRETINENITKELIALSVTTMSALADIPKPFKRPLTIVHVRCRLACYGIAVRRVLPLKMPCQCREVPKILLHFPVLETESMSPEMLFFSIRSYDIRMARHPMIQR